MAKSPSDRRLISIDKHNKSRQHSLLGISMPYPVW